MFRLHDVCFDSCASHLYIQDEFREVKFEVGEKS